MHKADDLAKHQKALLAVGAVGLAAFAITLAAAPQRAWAGVLLGNFLFLSLALCGLVFISITFVFSGGWAVVFRRVPEAMSAYLPVGALVMLALFFGRAHLYPWARPELVASDPHLQHKALWLNTPFFFLRMAVALGIWTLFAALMRRHSRRQDEDGDLAHTRGNQKLAAGFLVLFAVTFSFASFDWIMSLEPLWVSTIFPGYTFAGLLLGGTAAMLFLVVQFRAHGLLPEVTSHHLYELARVLCAAATFWAYIWFCQYMLIYYTNIPEESIYFAKRLAGGWSLLFLLNPVVSWVLPILLLIRARARRSPSMLLKVCGLVLVGRWLDLWLMIGPALGTPLRLGLPEVLIPLGFLPLFVLPMRSAFLRARPVPERDPYLVESVHLRV